MNVFGCIEGNPFIIRFKTDLVEIAPGATPPVCIEGNPFIIRFKTPDSLEPFRIASESIEGNPFIIRFKTELEQVNRKYYTMY